jgi:THO complex subunit 4
MTFSLSHASAMQELFRKTVGPVKDCFMIYNSQSKSKGMAIVTFAKASDATSAKVKYHGKIVDGRKSLLVFASHPN